MASRLRVFVAKLQGFFSKSGASSDFDSETQTHLLLLTEQFIRQGMSPEDAASAARRQFGNATLLQEHHREMQTLLSLETLWRDVRYGARQLRKSPGFTLTAVLTLALGIGANTAIFTLVHAVLLKSLPVASPQQLYRIGEGDNYTGLWGGLQGSWEIFDYSFYQQLNASTPAFEQIAAFSTITPSLSLRRAGASGPAQTIIGEFVSGNYFSTFGVQPAAGRLLNSADDKPEAPAVVVMGYRTWQQHYASDPSILGSTLLVDGQSVTLVGIAPRRFFGDRLGSDSAELWIPLHQEPLFDGPSTILNSTGLAWLYLVGRIKPGVAPAAVQTQLSAELQQWLLQVRTLNKDQQAVLPKQHIQLVPAGTGISPFRSSSKNGIYLLSIAAMLVLLIACANLANLLLARGAARQQQTALRLSLGATRSRLIRAVLTESVLLAVIGGLVGLSLAYVGTKAILLIAFRGASYVPIDASPSLPILAFALLLSILTGVVFGVAPAWIGSHADPSDGLRGSNRATAHHAAPQKLLVVMQAALSMVLLAVAGLVTQSLHNLEKADVGFETRGRLLASINPEAAGFKREQLPALYEQLEDRLRKIPGVRSASFSLYSPQSHCCLNGNILIAGRTDSWIPDISVTFLRVSPHYFETIGTPVLRGRSISAQDTPASQHVAVVDEAFARRFFPDEDPIGKYFGLSLPTHSHDYEIIGVTKNAKFRSAAFTQSPTFFLPFTQTIQYEYAGYRRLEEGNKYPRAIQLSVAGHPESYENSLRNALADLNPNLSATDVKSYSEQVAIQFNQQRLMARLTGLFSLLALLLASIGLYGVTTYNVTRRTSEIGIRMALGANRNDVVSLVLRGAFLQVGIGLCLGIPLAMACGRYLSHQLYEVSRFDPFSLGGAALVLSVCAFIAGFFPARRAASIEPIEALRTE